MAGVRGFAPFTRTVRSALTVTASGLLAWSVAAASPTALAASGTSSLTCFDTDVSGSNLVASGGKPPSDPGPVFVRQQVVELYGEVLADLGDAADQQVGVVTFGTGIGTVVGPVALSDQTARSRLDDALASALRPSPTEAAWTDWVAGVSGCEQMFVRSGATRGMIVMLTDGFPQGPAGGPDRQLAAISPMAGKLRAEGISIQPVLYGAGADRPGPARYSMTRLAAMDQGHLVLAETPLDMLRSALSLASLAADVPLGGVEISVDGVSSVPLTVPPGVATAVLVVLRSSGHVQVSVAAPGGKPLLDAAAGTGNLGLVVAVTRPAVGTYQAAAEGQGSVFAAELLRHDAVAVPSARPAGQPDRSAAPRAGHSGAHGFGWLLILALGLGALAIAALSARLIAARRWPTGTLVVWRGSHWRALDPVDLNGQADLAELVTAGPSQSGWSIRWNRPAPVVTGPDGSAIRLLADETTAVDTTPPATLTWFPGGVLTSLSDEPPGRPSTDP